MFAIAAAALMESIALLGLSEVNRLWYAVPLVVSVSLVYAATRHEEMRSILIHAVRFAIWVVIFMAIVLAVIQYFTWRI